MSFLRAVALVLRKDVAIERRSRELVSTTALFAVLVALLASLAFYLDPSRARALAPGVLWIALAFSGLLAMGRGFAREREGDAFDALLLSPLPRPAIYFGKALATFLFLAVVECLLVPFVGVVFHVDLVPVLGPLVALLALGTLGFVLTGTLFAALSVRTRARDLALSVVVFPLVAPALLCGVVGTRELFAGAPFADVLSWMKLLVAYDLTVLTVGGWLFGPLVED